MDVGEVNNAVAVADFPREVEDWVYEKYYEPFELVRR